MMLDLVADSPALFISIVFLLSLLIGSFLNVVIYRLPIMMDRQWREQAEEVLATPPVGAGAPGSGIGDRGSGIGDPGSEPRTPDYRPQTSAAASGAKNPSPSLQPPASSRAAADPSPSPQPPAPSRAEATPQRFNLLVPRSACPACGAQIKAWQNIPLVSYLLLRGRCANCKARIPVRYPVVELGTAILSAVVAWRFGVTPFTFAALLLTWSLIALTVIDIDHQLLPDNITLPLLWLGLVVSLIALSGTRGYPVPLVSAVIGAIAGYLSLWLVFHAFRLLTGKEGMGYGDFKLFGALGAWLGWQMLPLVILLSAATGAVIGIALIVLRGRDRNIPIPFGPYLAAAGWIALVWGKEMMGVYLRSSGLQ